MNLAFLMDPFESLAIARDSSLMMIEAALSRGLRVFMFESRDLLLEGEASFAHVREVLHCDITKAPNWYALGENFKRPLTDFHAIVVRKDPPFDIDYVFLTYLLERAAHAGVIVVNPPQALRDFNEKLVIFNFPDCIAETLVSANKEDLRAFWKAEREVILKPLDGLAGRNVFHVRPDEVNFTNMVEILTHSGSRPIMAQRYLKEARLGDKRILIIDGKPVSLALARLQREGETRSALSMGGGFKIQAFTSRDQFICDRVVPFLKEKGIVLAGLDIIGDYMTEINITSPTCFRQLSEATGQNLADLFLNALFT